MSRGVKVMTCHPHPSPRVVRTQAERRHSRSAATVLHGTESSADSKTVKQEGQSLSESKGRGKIKPYCPYCESSEHFLNSAKPFRSFQGKRS